MYNDRAGDYPKRKTKKIKKLSANSQYKEEISPIHMSNIRAMPTRLLIVQQYSY